MKSQTKRRIPFFLFLAFTLVLFWMAGCSPKGSYRVLRFFFDGVNDSTHMEAPHSIYGSGGSDSIPLRVAITEPAPSEFIYHTPYGNQKCSLCHDIAARSRLLKPVPELCYTCHTDFNQNFAYIHSPVRNGKCLLCHEHHLSRFTGLLKTNASALCSDCHSPEELSTISAHSTSTSKDCLQCHAPHGGADKRLLKP